MQMCHALSLIPGVKVTLVSPLAGQRSHEDALINLWHFYGVDKTFRIHFVSDPFNLRNKTNGLEKIYQLGGPLLALFERFRNLREEFIVYTRVGKLGIVTDAFQKLSANSFFRGLFCELHSLPRDTSALRSCAGIIGISEVLKNDLVAKEPGVCPDDVLVAHDGVASKDLSEVDGSQTRAMLGLRTNTKVIAYTGKIIRGKGVEVLIEAFSKLRDRKELALVLVGKVYGEHYQKLVKDRRLNNVIFAGYVPPCNVRSFQTAADILVVPSSRSLPYSRYTSPMKLFEYMAAKRPIIASSLDSIREVIHDGQNGVLFEPSNVEHLAKAISFLLNNKYVASKIAAQAQQDVREFTWERRAESIFNFIAQKTGSDTHSEKPAAVQLTGHDSFIT